MRLEKASEASVSTRSPSRRALNTWTTKATENTVHDAEGFAMATNLHLSAIDSQRQGVPTRLIELPEPGPSPFGETIAVVSIQ